MHPYFVGLDVHKQVIASRRRPARAKSRPPGTPWTGGDGTARALARRHGGATLFSHWIFRHLEPHAARLEMGHAARICCAPICSRPVS
jgi:hypothetical protein